MSRTFTFSGLALLSLGSLLQAADVPGTNSESPEDFRIEITGSAWILDSAGHVQSSGTVIDFLTDLGFEQQQPTFLGRLVFKPGRKHRVVIEGTPFAFTGNSTINRSITYQGQTFTFNEQLNSTADLSYIFAGYQYDVLSGPAGHLGFSVGGAYLDATATIRSLQPTVTSASRTQNLGLPLAGMEFRVFPLPGHKWVDVNGGLRGMGFGDYGHYVEGDANGRVWIGHVGLEAGYRVVNSQLQTTGNNGGGIAVRLKGPVFSLGFKW